MVVLSIDLEDFSQLNQEQEILNILIENLETLVIGGMGSYAGGMPERRLTVAGAEKIAQILRKFCRSKAIKAITFDCHMCYDEYIWERENESLILKGLDIYETDEENINLNMKDNNKIDKNTTMDTKEINVRDENITLDKKDINVRDENITLDKKDLDNETHCENVFEVIEGGTPYLDDERVTIAMNKIHKVDQSWIDFQENLKAIDEACKTSQLQEAGDKPTGNLEALSLCMNCFLYVGKYLPQCKTARRLAIQGSIIGNAPSDSKCRFK